MKKITYLCAVTVALLACVQVSAQNISFRGGASRLLYDGRYFPELYGEGVSPIVPSFDLKIGWGGDKDSPYANVIAVRTGDEKRPELVKLAKALKTPEVKKFIEDKYKGAVVPAF